MVWDPEAAWALVFSCLLSSFVHSLFISLLQLFLFLSFFPLPSSFSPPPSLLTLSLAGMMSGTQSLSRSRLFITSSLSLSSLFLSFSSFLIPLPPLTPKTGSWLPQNLYLACNCPDSNTD